MSEDERRRVHAANIEFHSALADQFNETQAYFTHENRERVRRILQKLAPATAQGRLLDLGCGTGFIISLAADLFAQIVGVDLTRVMLQRVPRARHVQVMLAQAESLPLASSQFQLVTAYGLLQHLHDYAPAFQEAYRCLTPGGWFYADESQNFYCAEGLGRLDARAVGDRLAHEIAAVVDDPKRYRSFGLDEQLVRTAMWLGKTRGGVREEDFHSALTRAGFQNIRVTYRWFLDQRHTREELGEKSCADIEHFLQSLLPLTRPLFKYVSFVAQKPA
jgi:ubiquinone/menaquinone biosynthesis C-methylase UbiE